MAAPGELIGTRISLISNKDIRYEGILFAINQVESSVTLKNVKCYGTEGRTAGDKEWKPDDKIYDYVMFSASDIKDLHVHEPPREDKEPAKPQAAAPPAAKPSPAQNLPKPPAPKPQQQPQQQQGGGAAQPPTAPSQQTYQQREGGRGGPSRGGRGRGYNNRRGGGAGGSGGGGGGPLPGTGSHLLGRRGRVGSNSGEAPEDAKAGEFDFESALQGFNKEEEFSKLNLNGTNTANGGGGESNQEGEQETSPNQESSAPALVVPEVKKYNKSSFFDDLSSGPGGERPSIQDERRTNMDTFGMAALHNPHRRFGAGGRGGGRGRGRGRGGYRGGRGRGGGYGGRGQTTGPGPRPPAKVSA